MTKFRDALALFTALALTVTSAPAQADNDSRREAKADLEGPEILKSGSVDPNLTGATVDVTGLSFSNVPSWLLIADSNLTTLDVSQPTVSFGVQRGSPNSELRLMLRKNAAMSAIEADETKSEGRPYEGNKKFGEAILNPANSNIGLSFRGYWWPGGGTVRYDSKGTYNPKMFNPGRTLSPEEAAAYTDAHLDPKKPLSEQISFNKFCNGESTYISGNCHTRHSLGFYGAADVAQTTFKPKTGPDPEKTVIPIKFSFGAAGRLEGQLPVEMSGTRAIRATAYLGGTSRFVGGDISEDYRRRTIGNRAYAYVGGEVGLELQLANLILSNELSVISPLGETIDNRAPGISGAQFVSTLTFFLDWRVTGQSTSKSNTKAATTKPDGTETEPTKAKAPGTEAEAKPTPGTEAEAKPTPAQTN